MTRQPKALIFDCDGTLADTMPIHWKAWQIISKRHGIHFPEDRFYSLGGVPTRHILQLLAKEQSLSFDPLIVAKEKEYEYLASVDRVTPISCVVEIARENFGKLPLAVASGGTSSVIDHVLRLLEIRHLFETVVTSEDVIHQKPAPDIFLEAARRLGVASQDCRAFEDTDLGMQSIRSAGMDAIDVRLLLKSQLAAN